MVEVSKSALIELGRAWNAFNEDEGNYERLGAAVRKVLGKAESEARRLLNEATFVALTDLPTENRPFGVGMSQAERDRVLRSPTINTPGRRG